MRERTLSIYLERAGSLVERQFSLPSPPSRMAWAPGQAVALAQFPGESFPGGLTAAQGYMASTGLSSPVCVFQIWSCSR